MKHGAMKHGLFFRILLITAVYLGLTYFGGIWGWKLLYPVRIFVTFLHEFGHAIGTVISGGWVTDVEIYLNGGGRTVSMNGSPGVILMSGYLGSAFFGNLLFLVGVKSQKLVKPTMALVIIAMAVTGFYWFSSIFTTFILAIFAAVLFWLTCKTRFARDALIALGLISVIYILQDITVGPQSDLKAYENTVGILPARGWMYVWLVLSLGLLALNLKILFSMRDKPEGPP